MFVSTHTAQSVHHYCEMHTIVREGNKTCVILHYEFLMVLFIQTYRRCFAAVKINVGHKCPPAQGGKQRLSSGVQAVEESKSERRGVTLTRGRWRNTWYYRS